MKKYGFTLIELLVVIAIIALLMGILFPALTRAKEMGKRAVCLHNLQQMMIGWIMYTDQNDDKIVCGDAEEYGDWETKTITYAPGGSHYNECPWVLKDWHRPTEPPLTIEQKKQMIMKGALFRYIKDVAMYRCETGERENVRMYAVVDSMNVIQIVGGGAAMIKNRLTIRAPYERIVYYDDGGTGDSTWGGFTIFVYKNSDLGSQSWWDPPPVRHGAGSTFSFADGHSEYHKWKDKRTIDYAHEKIDNPNQPNNEDMRWFSIGVWGSPPVDKK